MQIQSSNNFNTTISFQKYTPEVVRQLETKIAKLYADKVSISEIARITDTKECFVKFTIQKFKKAERAIKAQQIKSQKTDKKDAKIAQREIFAAEVYQMHLEGMSVREIAKKLNKSNYYIRAHMTYHKPENFDIEA